MPPFKRKGLFSGAGTILFLNESHCDVIIIVEHGTSIVRFPAHSLLLSAMSEVLRIMLEADLQEKKSRKITIKDSNPSAIKQFLRFLYTGEVEMVDWREIIDILALSHKYEVDSLLNHCEEQLMMAVTLSNVCYLHEVAEIYSLSKLLMNCQRLISDGAFMIFLTESFECLSRKSVEYFVGNRGLNVEDELTVLNGIRKWSAAECCRRCQKLTSENVMAAMEPFLSHVGLGSIPSEKMSFLPASVIEKYSRDIGRVKFFVPASLHKHVTPLKFVVELGSFSAKTSSVDPLICIKFNADCSMYIVGFRIVGMFRSNFTFGSGNPLLTLSREDFKNCFMHFNLNSLPWKCGSTVGDHMWKEMVAFFPQPARIEADSTYTLSIKYGNILPTRWPRTRAESQTVNTALGEIKFFTYGHCTGITELFLLPAPSYSSDYKN